VRPIWHFLGVGGRVDEGIGLMQSLCSAKQRQSSRETDEVCTACTMRTFSRVAETAHSSDIGEGDLFTAALMACVDCSGSIDA